MLILDEPTSALGASSTEMLLDVLRVLRDRQVGVVFVSHILEDVMALCDEVTVLRDGHVELSAEPRAELTVPRIVDAMLGQREVADAAPDATLKEAVAESVADDVGIGRLELRGRGGRGSARAALARRCARARSSGSRAWPGPATTRCSSWSAGCGPRTRAGSCCPTGARCRTGCGAPCAPASRW